MLYMVSVQESGSNMTRRVGRCFKTEAAAIRKAKQQKGKAFVESYHGRKGKTIVWANFNPSSSPAQYPREFSGARFA